eukprot:14354297-Alexandrium_andersonii.AAC.1
MLQAKALGHATRVLAGDFALATHGTGARAKLRQGGERAQQYLLELVAIVSLSKCRLFAPSPVVRELMKGH